MTLATLEDHPLARWTAVLAPAAQLAERIAGTEFVPGAMRGKPDVVLAAILYGDEIGVGPMQALAGIHIIDGRPQPSAELMRAMILRAGHSLDVHELTGTRARISGRRLGDEEGARRPVEWTIDMARAAGLLGRPNWQRYPRAMLLARATSDLARSLFPDVIKGLGYAAEETATDLDSWFPLEQLDAAPEEPPRKRVARKRRPPQIEAAQENAPTPRPPQGPPEPPPPAAPAPVPDPWTVQQDPWAKEPPIAPPPAPPAGPDYPVAPPSAAEQEGALLGTEEISDGPFGCPVEGCGMTFPTERGARSHVTQKHLAPPAVEDDGREDALLPDLEPEPGPQDPRPEPGATMIGAGMLRGLHAALGRILTDPADRDQKLRLVSAIIGRTITSTNDLTRHEGMRVTSHLMRIENGAATWRQAEDGSVVLEEREPPSE